MIMMHVIDDFVLQPAALWKMKKQKTWKEVDRFYRQDWICALIIHSMSWSSMILLPIMFLVPDIDDTALGIAFTLNVIANAIIDDLKVNRKKINLWQDQVLHFCQIIVTFNLLVE